VRCRAMLQLLPWRPASTDTGLPAGWKTGLRLGCKNSPPLAFTAAAAACCCCCQVEHVKAERNVLAEVHNPYIVKLYYSFQVRARILRVGRGGRSSMVEKH